VNPKYDSILRNKKQPDFLNNFQNIPAELKKYPNWVVFVFVPNGDKKPNKLPVSPITGYTASNLDSKCWTSFEAALAYLSEIDADGLFLRLPEGYGAIDIDNCIYPEGDISETALDILVDVETYTEISPSRTGLRLLFKGSLPGPSFNNRNKNVEMYDGNRNQFISVTGNIFDNQNNITDCNVDETYFNYRTNPKPVLTNIVSTPTDLNDEDVLKLIAKEKNGSKYMDLFQGVWQGSYPSQSEADLALCRKLWFYCGDRAKVEALFRQSGLHRPKFEKSNYRNGLANCYMQGETYTPPQPTTFNFKEYVK
jgi:putative DNA primase/helicase